MVAAIAPVGLWIGKASRLPAAPLLGPLVLTAILQSSGVIGSGRASGTSQPGPADRRRKPRRAVCQDHSAAIAVGSRAWFCIGHGDACHCFGVCIDAGTVPFNVIPDIADQLCARRGHRDESDRAEPRGQSGFLSRPITYFAYYSPWVWPGLLFKRLGNGSPET